MAGNLTSNNVMIHVSRYHQRSWCRAAELSGILRLQLYWVKIQLFYSYQTQANLLRNARNYIPNTCFSLHSRFVFVILHLPLMFSLDKVMNMWTVSVFLQNDYVAMGCKTWVSIPGRFEIIFFSSKSPEWPWDQPSLMHNVYCGFFSRKQGRRHGKLVTRD